MIRRSQGTRKRFMRRKQMEVAMSGNVTMLIWLGQQYLGQADKETVSGDFHHEHA
jgi:hypothetical protein